MLMLPLLLLLRLWNCNMIQCVWIKKVGWMYSGPRRTLDAKHHAHDVCILSLHPMFELASFPVSTIYIMLSSIRSVEWNYIWNVPQLLVSWYFRIRAAALLPCSTGEEAGWDLGLGPEVLENIRHCFQDPVPLALAHVIVGRLWAQAAVPLAQVDLGCRINNPGSVNVRCKAVATNFGGPVLGRS